MNDQISNTPKPRFPLGNVYFTPGVMETIDRLQVDPFELLYRHVCGDWGSVCTEDAQANEDALCYGSRILSAYVLGPKKNSASTHESVKIWVITEADRSTTTLLLPSEY